MDYRVIKENDVFLLTDEKGNIPENHSYGAGLYTKDTRYLSKFNVKINGENPVLLSSNADENYMATILLTNPHMEKDGSLILWRESVEIERKRFIYNDVVYELLKMKSYYPKPISFQVSVEVDVDFQDMFIVRGFQNGETGQRTGQEKLESGLRFNYTGADDIQRATVIQWDQNASAINLEGEITFDLNLAHGEEQVIAFTIAPVVGEDVPTIVQPEEALTQLKASYAHWSETTTKIETDNEQLQKLVDRGIADLRVLLTDLGYGKFPVAGLPWFAVPFGRDSLIAALQMLPFNPEVAKGTLKTMAAHQGTKVDPWRDEQPGKIMHEIRFGELANTDQIPFTPYFGTIDATPLFLVLLTEYIKWTGDIELFRELEANVQAAITWINQYGDRDGDGFVEYHQESSKGIANQGWKDSADSIVHRNGDYAETPIALSEVQGYVYQGKVGIAELYETIGNTSEAERLREEAAQLQEKFEQHFWMENHSFYALALDKDKSQVGTITSNPGHVLFSEMLNETRATLISDVLVSDKMFSGYGIRTMGEGEAGYNPMSYHDGSVWPHDNSMILLGMSKTKHATQAMTVIEGLMKSASNFEYDRLPELFCGYSDQEGRPVKYPVACSPQAWAAGTPLVFVQTMLGIFPNALKNTVEMNPVLPNDVNYLKVEQLTIGNGSMDFVVRRQGEKFQVDILSNTTGFNIDVNQKVNINI
ncbi:amylo-alpha-1,6-glucosidase [Alkalihalobacterium chitinilyticum]|uniref:Amylo-alpha-1,6-glucosidase n=1 Tax=Alkalihalobacterium chitinilyticum TaxID=2980103 RepID=A0ABT5VI16_9BACI|nr:amylo-alpha-1,6-glucosidase [Alkalihalobacterium chitinilyticum]MDE5415059.1 amylo-alpha-1,6-glucosidase [Alkalihalobacterium chitinilyticum]